MDSSKLYSDFLFWDAYQGYQRYLQHQRHFFTDRQQCEDLQLASSGTLEPLSFPHILVEQSSGSDTAK